MARTQVHDDFDNKPVLALDGLGTLNRRQQPSDF
jgi:hypothetical protein